MTKHTQILKPDIAKEINDKIKESEVSPTQLPEDQELEFMRNKINAIPYVTLLDDFPKHIKDELPETFMGRKYSFYGYAKFELNYVLGNNNLVKFPFHLMFLIHLIEPPINPEAAANPFIKQSDHFINWRNNRHNDANYRAYRIMCDKEGIKEDFVTTTSDLFKVISNIRKEYLGKFPSENVSLK